MANFSLGHFVVKFRKNCLTAIFCHLVVKLHKNEVHFSMLFQSSCWSALEFELILEWLNQDQVIEMIVESSKNSAELRLGVEEVTPGALQKFEVFHLRFLSFFPRNSQGIQIMPSTTKCIKYPKYASNFKRITLM